MTVSPALILSGFAVTGIAPTDQIDSVTAVIRCRTSDARTGPLAYELHDGETGALIGSGTGTASTVMHADTVTFPAPAWYQLFWLQLWIYASSGSAPAGAAAAVDYAVLRVSYVPSGIPFAAPVTATATALASAPDADGPRGRVFIDVSVDIGPTVSRSQAVVAVLTQGNGTGAGVARGNGTGALPGASRAQVRASGATQDDGTTAGLVTADRPA